MCQEVLNYDNLCRTLVLFYLTLIIGIVLGRRELKIRSPKFQPSKFTFILVLNCPLSSFVYSGQINGLKLNLAQNGETSGRRGSLKA